MLMMTWTQYKGSHGYKVESKKTDYAGNWIFLPAAGYRLGGSIYYTGSYGEYWSSTLDAREPCSAYYLKFHVALIRCCRQSSAWSTLAYNIKCCILTTYINSMLIFVAPFLCNLLYIS